MIIRTILTDHRLTCVHTFHTTAIAVQLTPTPEVTVTSKAELRCNCTTLGIHQTSGSTPGSIKHICNLDGVLRHELPLKFWRRE